MDRTTYWTSGAHHLDELFPAMDMLSRQTRELADTRRLSENDIQHIARPLATIRILLSALASIRCGSEVDAERFALAGAMAEQYLDLEGRIRELRNDLARERRALVP